MSYLPCELNCRTIHSNGDYSISELSEIAKRDHLALIAVTDCNTMSAYSEINDKFPCLGGVEYVTFGGSLYALGLNKYVDLHDADQSNIDSKIKELKANGAVVGIAHPFSVGAPVRPGGRWEYKIKNPSDIEYIEIWNGNLICQTEENQQAFDMWTELLDQNYKIAATYGRCLRELDDTCLYGCTYVDFENEVTPREAVRALRLGRTVVSTGAKFLFRLHRHGVTNLIGDRVKKGTYTFSFFTDVHSREKNLPCEPFTYDEIHIVTNGGNVVLKTRYDERHVRLKLESGHWYRAELWGKDFDGKRLLAVTSPVYCV